MSDNEQLSSRGPDPGDELAAMHAVAEALKSLPESSKARVIRWASELFGLSHGSIVTPAKTQGPPQPPVQSEPSQFSDAAELFSAASPTTDMEKALVTAYWVQYYEGTQDFDTQSINRMLAHMGHKVSNITRAFEILKRQKPALVVQTRKTGTTRQARKLFRVTTEGKKTVEAMLGR